MKKITFYFFTVLFACAFTSTAQTSKKIIDISSNTDDIIRCHADEVNAENLKSNPNMMGSDAFEDKLKAKIHELSQQRSAEQMVVLTIPVVVHVLNNGEAIGVNSNISDAQVLSQIEVLNEDFRRMLGTRGYPSIS